MTTFERILSELGEGLGIAVAPDADGVAEVSVENRVVLLRPESNGESATAFSVLATLPDGDSARRETLERALSLDLFGRDTLGGHVGLFGDAVVFSRDVPLEGLSAEDLADRLLAFARLAEDLAGKLAAGPVETPDDAAPVEGLPGAGLLRI